MRYTRAHGLNIQSAATPAGLHRRPALWWQLRDRGLAGYKFDRQVPIEPYIADFVCRSRKLVIELDGGQHQQRTIEDEQRTRWFNSKGYRVLRLWNTDVLANMPGVLETIRAELA